MTSLATPKTAQQPQRLRPKLSLALDHLATEGLSQAEAARRAGMNAVALNRALAKPHVKAELERRKINALVAVAPLLHLAKAEAIRVGMDLMKNAKSEAIRARMVEFFAPQTPRNQGVTVNVGSAPSGAYEFAPPPRDITPPDSSGEAD